MAAMTGKRTRSSAAKHAISSRTSAWNASRPRALATSSRSGCAANSSSCRPALKCLPVESSTSARVRPCPSRSSSTPRSSRILASDSVFIASGCDNVSRAMEREQSSSNQFDMAAGPLGYGRDRSGAPGPSRSARPSVVRVYRDRGCRACRRWLRQRPGPCVPMPHAASARPSFPCVPPAAAGSGPRRPAARDRRSGSARESA